MLDKFETVLWYYKKSSTHAFLTDIFLLIFSATIFVKRLDSICLIVLCAIIYSKSKDHLLSLSNPILAGTPIKIKDIINSNSLILWIKTVAIILSGLVISLFTQQVYLFSAIVALECLALIFPFFYFWLSIKYFVSKTYRTLTFYILVIALGEVFSCVAKFNVVISFTFILILVSFLLLISKIFGKGLTFEKILIEENQQ